MTSEEKTGLFNQAAADLIQRAEGAGWVVDLSPNGGLQVTIKLSRDGAPLGLLAYKTMGAWWKESSDLARWGGDSGGMVTKFSFDRPATRKKGARKKRAR